jgi:hypothetical protein
MGAGWRLPRQRRVVYGEHLGRQHTGGHRKNAKLHLILVTLIYSFNIFLQFLESTLSPAANLHLVQEICKCTKMMFSMQIVSAVEAAGSEEVQQRGGQRCLAQCQLQHADVVCETHRTNILTEASIGKHTERAANHLMRMNNTM